MKKLLFCSVALAVLVPGLARAGDKLLTGPEPTWVTPPPSPAAGTPTGAVMAVPRFDEQARVDGDTVTAYFDSETRVSSPEQLAKMGTLSMSWQPSHGDLTFHRIEILRGRQVMDVLKGGEGFTVLRREAGLEQLVVNGQLTAVKHIEGLQVGDVLHTVFSLSERDETLRGNVQDGLLLLPAPVQIGYGRARLVWPSDRTIQWKAMLPGITAVPRRIDAKWTELVVSLPTIKLPEMPKNIPSRFQPVPTIIFSSFADWGAVAKAMAPLYGVKGTIVPRSDLAARVDAIAAKSTDPMRRMADALRLVQDDVRYQLIALGTGNYVPQAPMDTWAKRYGDCKAKSRLLLAILDRLGIEAEPVLANTQRGDAVAQFVPAAMAFNHMIVRARVSGESYWLDGTSLGSRLADIHDVPRFGTVLPVFAPEGTLVDLPRRAHARPDLDIDVAYDMTSGPHLPAPFRMTFHYSGLFGVSNRVEPGADYDEKLIAFAEKAAKAWTGSDTIGKPQATYDAELATWTLAVDGVAYPDWKYRDGQYAVAVAPTLRVVFDAARDRASWRSIPAVIDQPWTAHSHVVTILPDGGKGITVSGIEPARLTFPAVDWQRSVEFGGAQLVEEITTRESGVEIPADSISATGRTITDAMGKTTHVRLAHSYPQHWDDVSRMRTSAALARVRAVFDQRVAAKPDDATRLADRAWFEERLFDRAKAETDYGKAIVIDGSAARYLARSRLRAERGDHPGALKDAQVSYDLEQGNNEARNRLAIELAEAGKTEDGLALLTPDPDITTDDGLAAFLMRIDVLETGNRHGDAIALLDGALDKRGSSAELRNARCWYEGLRNSHLESALSDCNRAIELASNPASYLDSRAMVHFRAGQLDLARADYEAALASSPEQSSSLFMAGIVHTALGDKGKAAIEESAARIVFPDIDHFYQRYGIRP